MLKLVRIAVLWSLLFVLLTLTASAAGGVLVSFGSPPSPFSQNKQNEPALAVDANHPNILVAGANDEIDMEACNAGADNTCPFTFGVGVSGVYFSFDSGATWTQPTYTGWTARDCLGVVGNSDPPCTAHDGPIGTLPWYKENGLIADGDPAVAFGPRRGSNGKFDWANGSRLYYANLTSNLNSKRDETVRGFEAIAVSRTDNVTAAAAGGEVGKNAWKPPVIVSRQSSTLFSDKEQIWADNAATSPFFGNVYLCFAAYRSQELGRALPVPIMVALSRDSGDTWQSRQVTQATTNAQHGSRSGCTIRTDSRGVVYVAVAHFAVGLPGFGSQELIKSYDGGQTWTRPTNIGLAVDTCFRLAFDGSGNRCVMDGIAGARDDLSPAPSIDIANGAPTGAGATNAILRTWVDGRDGLNHEHIFISASTNGGSSWSAPSAVETAGDRGYYSAVAISPNGGDAYLVYNAFTTPWRDDTSSPRGLVGVVKHADVNTTAGALTLSNWTELNRGIQGDPRGSSQNNLWIEFLGDYVYAVATNTYGAAVWNDVRNAADCPAIDAWRAAAQLAVQNGTTVPTKPAPQQACAPTFGNSDIFGGSYADPTP